MWKTASNTSPDTSKHYSLSLIVKMKRIMLKIAC